MARPKRFELLTPRFVVEGVGQSIYSSGRSALQAVYETTSDIQRVVKQCTEGGPMKTVVQNGRAKQVQQPFAVDGKLQWTRIRPDAVLPLRDAITTRFNQAAKKLDATSAAISEGIATLSRTIYQTIDEKPTDADTVSLHGEIRGYVSKLKDNMARTSFVMQAIQDSDLTVARACLGKKQGWLSGLSPTEHSELRRQAEMKFTAGAFKQREAAYGVLNATERAGSVLVGRLANLLNRPAKIVASKTDSALAALSHGR
jgi:hypothetical protein